MLKHSRLYTIKKHARIATYFSVYLISNFFQVAYMLHTLCLYLICHLLKLYPFSLKCQGGAALSKLERVVLPAYCTERWIFFSHYYSFFLTHFYMIF